jgi:hypothetical protein
MKKQLLYLLVSSVALAGVSCQKNDSADTPAPAVPAASAVLETEWEWTSSVGGIAGKLEQTPANSGRTERYVFKADGTCQQYANGQQMQSGTYTRGPQTSLLYHDQRDMITVSLSAPAGPAAIAKRYMVDRLSAQELVLREDVYDGFVKTYRKSLPQ